MRRLVIDTNVYIDWLNKGRHEGVLFQRDAVKYLSAVVLMELRAGAVLRGDRRVVQRLETVFERAGRILTPSQALFAQAGDTLRRLQVEVGYNIGGSHSIANDVLIALSARSIGAAVVTENERDYRAIEKIGSFGLIIVR
jgi:predicted nucleic acid-binding protein